MAALQMRWRKIVVSAFFVLSLLLCCLSNVVAAATRQLVMGVDGGTESIRACCFDAQTGHVVGKSRFVPYSTHHPEPGWAEQNPIDWWNALGKAVKGALQSIQGQSHEVCAIALDTTCCSVVALDKEYEPLRPCLLWMDQRSGPQTASILRKCKGDPALQVNCGGNGPLSAEWMTPKALWIYENEREIWDAAKTICEYQDFMNYKLTGIMCASSCNAASRWHWDGEKALSPPDEKVQHPGRPMSLYEKLGIPELADKLPQQCLAMGSVVGNLTETAAKHLGLTTGMPVVQGGPDAFVGMIGLGCIQAGQLCLITGSSHLHCVVTSEPKTAPGTWGAYRGAPLPGINFAEGGQSSTGSILRWSRGLFGAESMSYKELDEGAAKIPPGADGLIALETFQGSRTPVTDPLARGALLGLTLSHTRAHVWRALMEAVCFGTRACIEGLQVAGHGCDEIIMAGGATRSDLWLQMHADVAGRPVVVCDNSDAPLLGCAVLASVGVGIHRSVPAAVKAMVRTAKRILPNPETVEIYDKIYKNVYRKVAETVRPVVYSIHDIQRENMLQSSTQNSLEVIGGQSTQQRQSSSSESSITLRRPVISPSLLACDWANIREEVHRCMEEGLRRFHVDIFDGVFLDSPYALTFCSQMVEAIRRSCDSFKTEERASLELHMCVDRPSRYVRPMADVGADAFIFQLEAMESFEEASILAGSIVEAGMRCGVSIDPKTNVEKLYPVLETGLVDVVDVLAVEPGFGGQHFQEHVLQKIKALWEWRDARGLSFDIMVDGGVNDNTARRIVDAGADVLVAGTFLFNHPEGLARGVLELLPNTAIL